MPAQMIAHESRDEIIAVVVAGLSAQGEGDAGLLAGGLQQLRAKLLGEELIGIAIVDQQIPEFRAILDQRDRVMRAPCTPVVAEITALTPDSKKYTIEDTYGYPWPN